MSVCLVRDMQAMIRFWLVLALALVLLVLLVGVASTSAAPVARYRVYLPLVTVSSVCPPDYRQAPDPIGGCGDKR